MAFSQDASPDNGGDAASSVFIDCHFALKPLQLDLKKLEETLSLFPVLEGLSPIPNGPVGQVCS